MEQGLGVGVGMGEGSRNTLLQRKRIRTTSHFFSESMPSRRMKCLYCLKEHRARNLWPVKWSFNTHYRVRKPVRNNGGHYFNDEGVNAPKRHNNF